MLIGFDPGRDKCGLAIASADGTVIHREVVPSAAVEKILLGLCQRYGMDPVAVPLDLVMGNQTTARQWRERLLAAFPKLAIQLVDERFSSQEARERYWLLYPPRGWQRLVPKGMRLPPCPVDDIVAAILIERFLNRAGEE